MQYQKQLGERTIAFQTTMIMQADISNTEKQLGERTIAFQTTMSMQADISMPMSIG